MNTTNFYDGSYTIEYKINEITRRLADFDTTYRKKYGKRFIGKWEKVYMIHQELEEGKSPTAVYIGKTKQEALKRLNQHTKEIVKARSNKIEWTVKLAWMSRILHNGFALKIRLLNEVPKFMVYAIEQEWIVYLGIRGFNVMNTNNKKYWNGR